MADGSIRISTKLDNSNIDKDIIQLENKIKKLQINNKKKSHEQDSLQEEIKNYDELCIKADEYRNKIAQLEIEKKEMLKNNPSLAVSTDSSEYANIKNQIDEIKLKYQEATIEIDKQSPKIEKSRIKLEEVKAQQEENNSKIAEYNKKLEEAKNKQQEVNYSTKGISKELNTGIKKILRYGAALISIRSVYGLLSSAANSWLSGNNSAAKQLKSDIDYMKNAIGHALSPVIKYIVDLLYQALGFTGALIKAFTGIDIFAGSVADYMSKTTSSASKTNKELKKQLLSFDRINKLNDNSSNSSGSGVGTIAPSQDLSKIMENYTEQAEKLKEIFEKIKDYAPVIGSMFVAWKLGELLSNLGILKGSLKEIGGIKPVIGISLVIGSIVSSIGTVNKLANGELNSETITSSILESLGLGGGLALLGVGAPITIPLSVTLLVIKALAYVDSKIKLDEKMWKPIYDTLGLEYSNDLSQFGVRWNIVFKLVGDSIKIVDDIKDRYIISVGNTLWNKICKLVEGIGKDKVGNMLYNVIWQTAEIIKNIPFIGKGIGTGIQQGLKLIKKDITNTTTETIKNVTKESTDNASGEIGYQGIKSGKLYADSLKGSFKSSMSQADGFRKAIEDSTTKATEEAKNNVDNNGKKTGITYVSNMKEQIASSKTEVSNTISRTTRDAINSSLSSVNESGKKIGTKVTEGIKEAERNKKNDLSNNLTGVVKDANNNVDTSSANKIGSNIISGVKSGINDNKSSLFSTIRSVGSTLLNNFKNVLGIHSPSREMASLAKFIPLGIAEGIDSTQDKALGSMKNLVYGLEDTMNDVDYSPLTEIPKIPRNAVTYVPKQSISTNEIQRSIVGQDSSVINKLLSNLQTNSNKNMTVTIPLIIDGEEFVRKVIELNGNYNLATNGGGL